MTPGQTGLRVPDETSRAGNLMSMRVIILLVICSALCFTYGLFTPLSSSPNIMPWRRNTSFKNSMLHPLPGVWISSTIGRLGNQMGAYAALYGLAQMNGRQAYLSVNSANELGEIFQLTLPRLPENENKDFNNFLLHDWMEESYEHISPMRVHLTGYPNSWTFYDRYRDAILREFTFRPVIRETADTFLRSVAAKSSSQLSGANMTFVGVHVRRGDYVRIMPNVWKGVVADAQYLIKAMTHMRGRHPDSVFVVASDDVTWCRQNINVSRGDVYFAADGIPNASPGQDLAVLAACNHTIMTIGTFGFWAGYLSGGDVIYMDKYVMPNSPFLKVFRYEAFYLPHWKGIPANSSAIKND
uniref:galactoside alpha-(1,2)-fucosyltransferase 2-like isoform X1 n=1 Tax=Myxine glutinosa TaxID=7769 RepID=UPI00358FA9AB